MSFIVVEALANGFDVSVAEFAWFWEQLPGLGSADGQEVIILDRGRAWCRSRRDPAHEPSPAVPTWPWHDEA